MFSKICLKLYIYFFYDSLNNEKCYEKFGPVKLLQPPYYCHEIPTVLRSSRCNNVAGPQPSNMCPQAQPTDLGLGLQDFSTEDCRVLPGWSFILIAKVVTAVLLRTLGLLVLFPLIFVFLESQNHRMVWDGRGL